jgi:hypothetical protein
MLNLLRAIARVLGFQTQPSETPVQPIQTVGPVRLGRTTPAGNQPSVQDTNPLPQLSPVRPRSQKKPKPAQQTTQASKDTSKKQKPVATAKSRKQPGSSTPTPASKIHLPVKPVVKAKAARVPSIKAVLLSQQEQAHAQTLTEAQFGGRGKTKTTARKTRQHVK